MTKSSHAPTIFFKKYLSKIIAVLVIIFLILVIKGILNSIFELQNNSKIVLQLKNEEVNEKQQEQFLNERLYYVKTPEFIERQAREKLGMVKEGEYIVLAPPSPSQARQTEKKDSTPNWKKWLNLFF